MEVLGDAVEMLAEMDDWEQEAVALLTVVETGRDAGDYVWNVEAFQAAETGVNRLAMAQRQAEESEREKKKKQVW